MKKIASIVLALVLVLAMAAPAMAAETVTNTETSTHTYDVYQVFSGTQTNDAGDIKLGDIEWGEGVDGAGVLAALKADTTAVTITHDDQTTTETTISALFAECETAADVAEVLAGKDDDCAEAKALANAAAANLTEKVSAKVENGTTTVELDPGYYLLVDTTNVSAEHDARNSALLQVTKKGTVEIKKKYDVPTVDKDIIENSAEVEAADKNIGDTVDFKITGTLPTNYADYETYKYVFNDTMHKGLTYNNDIKVYVVNGTTETDVTTSFTVTPGTNEDGHTTLKIACDDLKKITGVTIDASSNIVVEYSATLNADAEIGNPGNFNKVDLEFSNDPNFDGDGDEPTGKTPEDEVLVFTYELDVTKKDQANQSVLLKDAEFVLYRQVEVEDEDAEGGKKTVPEYVKVDATTGKVTGWTQTKSEASTLKSDEQGLFNVIGLDEGTYYLEETKAPAGYNLLTDPIKVVIEATINTDEENTENSRLTALTISVGEDDTTTTDVVENAPVSGDLEKGSVAMDVLNNAGTVLPETGGIGTTIFYVAGGLLMVGALVLLITKRKVESK